MNAPKLTLAATPHNIEVAAELTRLSEATPTHAAPERARLSEAAPTDVAANLANLSEANPMAGATELTQLSEATPMDVDAGDNATVDPAVLAPNSDEMAPTYGGEVSAMPPRQDMYVIDTLAGGPPQDRTANPATFTAGDTGKGLGGQSLGLEPGKAEAPGYETGERIGI